MSGRIFLIVEDKTDAQAVEALLKAHNVDIKVNPRVPTGGSGGLSRLAKQLEQLIQTARNERQAGDCIAVLHDADQQVQRDRGLYKVIADICEKYNDVVEVIAYDEIEAWLLADEGLCHWLDTNAKNCDEMKQPSLLFKSLVKKKIKRDYSGSDSARVLGHLNGRNHSESLKKELKHLENAPCVKESA